MPKTSNRSTPRKGLRAKQSSCIYRVRNWSAYDEALKQRGSVMLWFAPEAVAAWNYQGAAQRGAQFVYSDLAIETALTLRLIYHLPFCLIALAFDGVGSVGAGSFDAVATPGGSVGRLAHPYNPGTDPRGGR